MSKPKNYETHALRLTQDLRHRIAALQSSGDEYQAAYAKIESDIRPAGSEFVVRVSEADITRIKYWAQRPDESSWQQWARDVLAHNRIALIPGRGSSIA